MRPGSDPTGMWGALRQEELPGTSILPQPKPPRTENAPDSATMHVAEVLAERQYGHTSWEGRSGHAMSGAYSRCSTTERAALWAVAERVVERLQAAGYLEPVKEGT